MKQFNLDNYKSVRYAMHCKTLAECESFIKFMNKNGKYNKDVINYATFMYDRYKDQTCFNFNDKYFGSLDYYERLGFTILEWSDFTGPVFCKDDLKNFDITVNRIGNAEIVNRDLEMLITSDESWNDLEHVRDDLTNMLGVEYDIIKVYRPTEKYQCSFDKDFYEDGELVYNQELLIPKKATLDNDGDKEVDHNICPKCAHYCAGFCNACGFITRNIFRCIDYMDTYSY